MTAEDWIPDYAFEDGGEDEDECGGYLYQTKTCRRCGIAGLHWGNDDGRWVLVSSSGETHNCGVATLDEFEDVSK